MAIQNRRGQYTDFNPSNMVAGEFAVVQSGDENTTSGKAVYMAFGPGDVQRLVTDEEMSAEVGEQVDAQIADALETKVDKVTGKGLSTNDYDDAAKLKLAGIQENAKNIFYGTCSTSAGTSAKVVSCSNFQLADSYILIKFGNSNTVENITLNVNSTGAFPVTFSGSAPHTWSGQSVLLFRFVYSTSKYELMQVLTPVTYDGRAYSTLGGVDGDFTHYAVCSVNGGSNKSVDINGYKLVAGAWIAILFTQTNTHTAPQLSVGSTAWKSIKYRGQNLPSPDYIKAGGTYLFVYDGTYWEIVGDIDTSYRPTLDANGIAHL